MRSLATLSFLLFLALPLMVNAQRSISPSSTKIMHWNLDIGDDEFIKTYGPELGLGKEDELRRVSSEMDFIGFVRNKYQQYYRGLPVHGAIYTLHRKDSLLVKTTGVLAPELDVEVNPKIQPEDFLERMKVVVQRHIADHYNVLNPEDIPLEIGSQRLVLFDRSISAQLGRYTVAWEVEMISPDPSALVRHQIYLDASTGKMIFEYSNICSQGVPATGSGYYYENVQFQVDSIHPSRYELHDPERNIYISDQSQDDHNLPSPNWSEDNTWDYQPRDLDGAIVDAMYATRVYYDNIKERFDREGMNGSNGPMICNVNFAQSFFGDEFFVNAYWNGYSTSYGAGDCQNYGPLTTLSIVGHEFTHGMTEFSAGLIYADESGALNESFSDIFGESMEYLEAPQEFQWTIGDRFRLHEFAEPFRDMSDPNRRYHPKYYYGNFWSTSGAVHTNSGVQNHWYYLLVEGGSGVNEAGESFEVEAIGLEKALQIAYLNLTQYLTPWSGYRNAREYSLEAAADLFGENSAEYRSVEEAWKAVGVRNEPSPIKHVVNAQVFENAWLDTLCMQPNRAELEIPVKLYNNGVPITQDNEVVLNMRVWSSFHRSYIADTNIVVELDDTFDSEALSRSVIIQYDGVDGFAAGFYDLEFAVLVDNVSSPYFHHWLILLHETKSIQLVDILPATFCRTVGGQDEYRLAMGNLSCASIPDNENVSFRFSDSQGYSISKSLQLESKLEPYEFRYVSIWLSAEERSFFEGDVTVDMLVSGNQNPRTSIEGIQYMSTTSLTSEKISFESIEREEYKRYMTYIDEVPHSVVRFMDDNWLRILPLTGLETSFFACAGDDPEEHFERFGSRSFTLCVNTEGLENPQLSWNAVFFDAYDPSSYDEHFATMYRVISDWGDTVFVWKQDDGQPVQRIMDLPSENTAQIDFEILVGAREVSTQTPVGIGPSILIDDIEIRHSNVIEEDLTSAPIHIVPNPNGGSFGIINLASPARLTVYNISGQLVYQNDNALGWIPADLVSGVYFYILEEEDGTRHEGKLVVY